MAPDTGRGQATLGERGGKRVLRVPTAPLSIGFGLALAIGIFAASFVALPAGQAQSRAADRTLKLYFGNTGERSEFTYMRNGRYDRAELKRINRFLRDWRKNQPTQMDPKLLDLVWAIYKESGSRDYIYVICGYRSPATNGMLRARSSGVAKNSQHVLGKALDFYLPDVPLAKLRAIAMKAQGGGVGYYPRSGAPFVHVDTGNVRAWPRMTRQQLIALFPNGNTLHLPADGKPLPGYELAVARRKSGGSDPVLAYLDTEPSESEVADRTGTNSTASSWLRRVFPKESQEDSDLAESTPEAVPAVEEQLATAEAEIGIEARPPRARPASEAPIAEIDSGTAIAAADAEAIATLAVPAVPRVRPNAESLADTLEPMVVASLEVEPEDAIAALAARVGNVQPSANERVETAFSPVPEPPGPAAADRAILAAFAALDEASVREADADLTAAITRLAAGDELPAAELTPVALAFAGSELPEAAAAAEPAVVAVAPGSGIVLAPDGLADYREDSEVLAGLIETDEATPEDVRLAMPDPKVELYAAPEASSEVAGLRGVAGPPADRYVRGSSGPDQEQGFFTRLFASLIE